MKLPNVPKVLKTKKTLKFLKIGAVVIIIAGALWFARGLFVVAVVNGRPITRLSLVSELEKQGAKQVLDSLVTQELIVQEASKQKIQVTDADVQSEITNIETQLKSQNMTLDSALSMQGQTRDDLTKSIKLKLVLEKILAGKITVTDKEIQDYFDQNKTQFPAGSKLADLKAQITSTLNQQKLSTEYQAWIKDIKDKASLIYLKQY